LNICFYGYAIQDVGCGSAEYFTLLAKKMTELGNRVTVVSSGTRRDDLPLKIKFISLNKENSRFQKYIVFPIKSLWFFLHHRFDLIHAGSSYSRFACLLKFVYMISRIPVIYTVFSDVALPANNPNFHGLIFISKRLKNKYRRAGIYAPPFIDVRKFNVRSQYNFRKSYDLIIGTMGTPLPRRGHEYLLKAIPLVLKKYPNAFFVLAIALPQIQQDRERKVFEGYKDIIKKLSLENNVLILGEVDIAKFLKSIDILVYPLQTAVGAMDITPTILQCLASGCCLITTDVGATREIIKDGYNGILIRSKDYTRPEAYATKIIELIENESLRQSISKNAKKSSQQYDINQIAPKILRYYRQIYRKNLHL